MHRLGPNGAVPELLEASGLGAGGRVDSSPGIGALEEGPEGGEDAGAGAERHGGACLVCGGRHACVSRTAGESGERQVV